MTDVHETASRMMATHPSVGDEGMTDLDRLLVDCIDACLACEQTCTACADACLSEEMVAELRRCIRLNLDCADLCSVTARILSRRAPGDLQTLVASVRACADACRACATECEQHAEMHEHCRVCAEACRRCLAACEALLAGLDH